MPLLDIATPQSSFRNNPYSIGFQRLHHVSFISGNQTTARSRFFKPNGIINPASGRLMIKAVATLEPRCSDNANHQLPIDSTPTLPGTDDQPVVIDDREILRRSRISDANRGKQPWNKGRKHSAETREKIRESTRIAMRSETVRMKLRKAIHSQTLETRSKIAAAVRVTWNKRRFQQKMMSHCQQEWRNLVSEASRKGFCGEEELQWDSYEIIQKQLTKEYRAGVESRKEYLRTNSLKPEGQRGVSHLRAPKTPEQRKKISEAIAAKWADPTYRERVYSGISKRRGLDPERRDPEWGTGKRRKEATKLNPSPRKKRESFGGGTKVKSPPQPKVKTSVNRVKKEPQARFKDPQANYKLEMIKSIRAQRAGSDSDSDSDPKINEAVLRANVLIGEAQRAAEALEEAAAKSPVAEASLIETRKLIAEAIRYIESIEMGNNQSLESGNDKDEKMVVEDVRGIEQRGVNGIGGVGLGDGGIGMLADVANGRENIDISASSSSSSSSTWGDMGLEMKEVEGDGDGDGGGKMVSEKQERKGRRWVCGRLVEDEEDE
ncbi:unnamed protein product [Lactuca saligna]|uniref:Nuclease associated modular domain-containing protein n=1 Tax=Lactuca saligna TaxID=75948 RepID=A0AA35Z5D5_LACSI|nr:unnamed protein product [Lactuca saligna]